jgi:uncharacterized sulfatase
MNRRDFIKLIAAAALPTMLPGCNSNLKSDCSKLSDKPNVVVILSDDHGWGHFAANMGDFTIEQLNYGFIQRDINIGEEAYDPKVAMKAARMSTQNMARLATDGVRLTNAYVPLPLCSPSRCALMTARYPQRYGAYCNLDVGTEVGLPKTEYCLAKVLKANGYTNGIIGKWHLQASSKHREDSAHGHPLEQGFDYYFGFNGSTSKYVNPTKIYRNYQKVKPQDVPYTTDAFTDEAIGFIDRNKEKPFFLYLAYNAVHGPYTEKHPEKYTSRFKTGSKKIDTFNGMMAAMDDGVGQILDKLKQQGLEENTLVIFYGDNGPGGSKWSPLPAAGPLRGMKGHIWQGGCKIPMAVKLPGVIPAGTTYDGLISSMDIMPTIIELTGAKVPADLKLDGKNMLGAISGKCKKPVHEKLFFVGQNSDFWGIQGPFSIEGVESNRGNDPVGWSMRKGDYMLRYWGDTAKYELYNVTDDPGEKNNIISQKHADMVEEMKQDYKKWFAQMIEPNRMNKDRWLQLVPKY